MRSTISTSHARPAQEEEEEEEEEEGESRIWSGCLLPGERRNSLFLHGALDSLLAVRLLSAAFKTLSGLSQDG